MSIRVIVGIVIVALLGTFCLFRVDQTEQAVLFRLGEIRRSDFEPGLHFMIPVINTVRKYDIRLRTLDAEPQRFLTGEQKALIVDSFVKWRIENVELFYRSTGGDRLRAENLLRQQISDGLRSEFGKRTVQEVVSNDRRVIMRMVTENALERAADLGIHVVDVRLKQIDLPDEVSTTVYDRMRSERQRVARELRARGDKEALRIQADAERQRTVLRAGAYRQAETLRGEGDARATETYARQYSKNYEFYDFYRSLNAYRNSFSVDDVLILEPNSDFFKYMKDASGVAPASHLGG